MQVHVSVNIGIGHVVNPLYLKWGIQIKFSNLSSKGGNEKIAV